MSSHLCKAAWPRPDTFEPTHPEKQTTASRLLAAAAAGEASAHPDQEGRVENVLDGPGERVGVDDELVIRDGAGCCGGGRGA